MGGGDKLGFRSRAKVDTAKKKEAGIWKLGHMRTVDGHKC